MPVRETAQAARRPLPLTVAVVFVGLEALALLLWAVLVLVHVSTMSVTSAVFFLVYAAALTVCGYGILGLHSWARSPVVLTQLLMLGLAWDARHTVAVALPMGLVALATLGCLLSRGGLTALSPHDD